MSVLSSIIGESLVRLHAEAENWEDAIRKGGQLLVDDGRVSEAYVQGMIDSVKEVGPYIVIVPHLAMPHADPALGAVRSGLSILTLATPVWFGNGANDPVKYVFCLSEADKADHLLVMRSFVAILEDEHFFEVMDTAKTGGEIVQYMLDHEVTKN